MDAEAWNERYAGDDLVWSAGPNRFVVDELAALGPGTALDMACGEGRNAIWLAQQGWSVRAVDFAEQGVAKGRRLAAAAGVAVHWVVADVTRYRLRQSFDLVLIAYLHLPSSTFAATLQQSVRALAARGTLLVIGHHVDNVDHGVGGPDDRDVLHDHDAIAAALGEAGDVELARAARVERPVDGADRPALDSVVRVQRR